MFKELSGKSPTGFRKPRQRQSVIEAQGNHRGQSRQSRLLALMWVASIPLERWRSVRAILDHPDRTGDPADLEFVPPKLAMK